MGASYGLLLLALQWVACLLLDTLLPPAARRIAWPLFYVCSGYQAAMIVFALRSASQRGEPPATGAAAATVTPTTRHRRRRDAQSGDALSAATAPPATERTNHTSPVPSRIPPRLQGPPPLPEADAAAFHAAVGGHGPRPLQLLYKPLQESEVKVFDTHATVLSRPLPLVAAAMARKYKLGPRVTPADALQPPVLGIDELGAHELASPDGAVVRWSAQRVRFSLEEVPALLRRFVGVPHLEVLIDSEVHYRGGRPAALLIFARNGNGRGIATFQEAATYTPHPQRPADWTLYVSRCEAIAASWAGRRLLALAGSSTAELIQTHVEQLQARMEELAPEPARGPAAAPSGSSSSGNSSGVGDPAGT